MPPSRALDEGRRGQPAAAERRPGSAREQSSKRLSLVTTVADMQRRRRKRVRVERAVKVAPVSDYRDLSG